MPTLPARSSLNIIARKPRGFEGSDEYIVVDRGPLADCRFVSATANAYSLSYGEWYWGHYFSTMADAMAHFNSRA